MKRRWLKVIMLAMMASASFGSAMNPKEIEDLMYVMNQTRIEFTVPDEDDSGEGGKTGTLMISWNCGRNGAKLVLRLRR